MRQGMPGEQRWRPLGRSTGIHSIEKIIGGESQVLEELNAISDELLRKAGLIEMNEKLKSF